MATVTGIYIKTEKDSPRREIEEGMFLENHGLDGDANSGEGPRQVCLLRREDREELERDSRDGLCFPRFLETVQVEGLELNALETGSWLRIGDTIMKVSLKGKKCWPECEIIKAKSTCVLAKGVRFLEVLEQGRVKKGDQVTPI